jgi:hypothetical protein
MKMVPSKVRKLNFEAPTFDYCYVVGGMPQAKLPGATDGKLAATARGTQTSPPDTSTDKAHPSLPGDFPSLNVNNLEEACEYNTTANQASEADTDHNQYQVLVDAEGEEEEEDVLMALDEVKDKAEDKVEDEAEDKLKDEEEDEEEMEDIPMKFLPMLVHNHCLCYNLKIMVPPVDNPVAAAVEVLQSILSHLQLTDPKLILYPWKMIRTGNKNKCLKADKMPKTLLGIQEYFHNCCTIKKRGTQYIQVFVGHSHPFDLLHVDIK